MRYYKYIKVTYSNENRKNMKKVTMESIIKKILTTTGLAIGAIVALTPLSALAADQVSQSGEVDVTVNVKTAIVLDAATGTSMITPTINTIGTGSISAKVTSTGIYTISLSSSAPALQHKTVSSASIPSIDNVVPGTAGWGVKKKTSATSDASNYSAVTSTPTVFYTSSAPAAAATTVFSVGVGASPITPAGDYSTNVTITAALKP